MALQHRSQLHLQGRRGTDLVGADGVPCVAAEPSMGAKSDGEIS